MLLKINKLKSLVDISQEILNEFSHLFFPVHQILCRVFLGGREERRSQKSLASWHRESGIEAPVNGRE